MSGQVLSFDILPWQLDTFWSQTNEATLNCSEYPILTVSSAFFHCEESACMLPTITEDKEDLTSK